jgi:hypothetical protein
MRRRSSVFHHNKQLQKTIHIPKLMHLDQFSLTATKSLNFSTDFSYLAVKPLQARYLVKDVI